MNDGRNDERVLAMNYGRTGKMAWIWCDICIDTYPVCMAPDAIKQLWVTKIDH
jgi:hypothetical protein